MTLRRLMTACVIAAGIGGAASMVASTAHAKGAMEAEIVGFHQLCEIVDLKSLVGPAPCGAGTSDRRYWRRAHADWFWFER
jgi:hypothetical protein